MNLDCWLAFLPWVTDWIEVEEDNDEDEGIEDEEGIEVEDDSNMGLFVFNSVGI